MNESNRYDPSVHHRRSIRLKGYDYSQAGGYFITICTFQHRYMFGEITAGEMRLNELGEVVAQCWHEIPIHFIRAAIDAWVIMPNHIHGIIFLSTGEASAKETLERTMLRPADASPLRPNGTQPGSVGAIIQNFKSIATRRINAVRGTPGLSVWQRNYWERILRDERSYERVAAYIRSNPAKWDEDTFRVRDSEG